MDKPGDYSFLLVYSWLNKNIIFGKTAVCTPIADHLEQNT